MAGGKSNWNDEPIKKNGVICGRKTFDLSDKSERLLCANELLCRQFLKDKKSTFITNLVVIEPETVQALLDRIDSDNVRCDFCGERDRLEKSLSSIAGNVTLYIELGTSDTKALFKDYATDYTHHETEILSIIRRLFEMVNVMQKIGFVNTDIKADNLIYSERDNEPSLIMNDFDTSFILNTDKGIRFKAIDKHPFTEPAPELVGWHTENRVSNWTDIFISAILAYRLLNNFEYPEAFINAKSGISDITERYFEYQRLFNNLSDGLETIAPPANGSPELKEVILRALKISPEERPTSSDILKVINNSIEHTNSNSQTSSLSDSNNSITEVLPVSNLSKSKSRVSYAFLVFTVIAFISIVSFVIIKQLKSSLNTHNEDNTPVIIYDTSIIKNTSVSSVTDNPLSYFTTVSQSNDITSSLTSQTNKRTNNESKTDADNSPQKSGNNNNERTTTILEPENIISEQTEAAAEETTQLPTEALLPFDFIETTIDGGGVFKSVSGIEIIGYSSYEDIPSTLIIPDMINGKTVVSIGNDAFCGCDIEELIIPDTVVYIGNRAFCNCFPLWKITLGKNVSMIGEQAFFNAQYTGFHEQEINILNPKHGNCEEYFGKQWDGREHDYLLIYN